ncbi:hypothetical protein [Acinetobacter thermotolerans]
MTHPCENKCPNYNGEQCNTCLVQDDVDGAYLIDVINELVDEIYGESE